MQRAPWAQQGLPAKPVPTHHTHRTGGLHPAACVSNNRASEEQRGARTGLRTGRRDAIVLWAAATVGCLSDRQKTITPFCFFSPLGFFPHHRRNPTKGDHSLSLCNLPRRQVWPKVTPSQARAHIAFVCGLSGVCSTCQRLRCVLDQALWSLWHLERGGWLDVCLKYLDPIPPLLL